MTRLIARLLGVAVLAAGVLAVPSTATAHETCETAQDVPIVVEFGSLDGEDEVLCAVHGSGTTALDALHEAGLETEMTSAAAPMVCRIDGQPAAPQETCGDSLSGDGYWAFLVAKEGEEWGYASTGLDQYELADGDFVAVVYHLLADGEKVPVAHDASAATRADAVVPTAEESHDSHAAESESDFPIGLVAAVVAASAVAAAAFVVARRRR